MAEHISRVAVVTGGAGAIGGAIVAELAAAGHTVVSLDLAGDPPVDLARADQVRAAAARVLDSYGRCDVLVHAAAAFDRADLATLDLDVWRRVQAVNVEAALLLSQAFVPGMAARGADRPDAVRGRRPDPAMTGQGSRVAVVTRPGGRPSAARRRVSPVRLASWALRSVD